MDRAEDSDGNEEKSHGRATGWETRVSVPEEAERDGARPTDGDTGTREAPLSPRSVRERLYLQVNTQIIDSWVLESTSCTRTESPPPALRPTKLFTLGCGVLGSGQQ